MAAKGFALADKFSRWGITVGNLKEHLADFPHLADDLAEMERMLGEVRVLETRQEDLRGQAREINRRLKDMARSGEKLRSRLRSGLAGKVGVSSETLVKFGFRPVRPPRRTRKTDKPAPQPNTPAATSSPSPPPVQTAPTATEKPAEK